MAVCPQPDRGCCHTSKAPPGIDRHYSLAGDLGASWKTFRLRGCSVRGSPGEQAGGVPWSAGGPGRSPRSPPAPPGGCWCLLACALRWERPGSGRGGLHGPNGVPSCSSQHLVLQGTPNPGRVARSEGLGGLTQGERVVFAKCLHLSHAPRVAPNLIRSETHFFLRFSHFRSSASRRASTGRCRGSFPVQEFRKPWRSCSGRRLRHDGVC